MKVTAVTIHYTEARSARYQKVEHGVSLTVELAEGETVTAFTGEEIVRLADEMDQMTGGTQEGRRGR